MPRVHDSNIEPLAVARIARRNGRTTRLRDAGDQSIAQVDDTTSPLAIGSDLGGPRRGHLVEGEHTIR